MSKNFKFKDVVIDKKGFLRGPFGGDLKKEIFVKQSKNTYKVYEQGVVLNSDKSIGRYYISEEDYLAKLHKFYVEDKDFLISCSGVNMGAIYQLKAPFEKGIINQALLRIRLNNDIIDDNYFFYLFKELISRRITSGSGDSTIPNFPALEVIKNIEFELPDKLTQVNVGKLLTALDSKIELNNRINAELEAMVKTLYDYWFVQFDFPDKNGKPYKSSGGKMVWNEELNREIPDGWEVGTLLNNSFAEILKPGIKKFSGKKNYLATADINNKDIGIGREITYLERKSRANMQPIKNSIWFAKMKNSRKHLFIGQNSYDVITDNILSTGFMGLSCTETSFEYLASYVSSDIFEITKDTVSHGATMQGIGNDDLKFFKIVVPDVEILADFKKEISTIYEKMELSRIENQKLTELRDWLLPMLMNGQVKVT